jgi:hypothetical protein
LFAKVPPLLWPQLFYFLIATLLMASIIKFYGDSDLSDLKNHLYQFHINNRRDAEASLKRFESKGIIIRAAWYHNTKTGERSRIR